MIKVNELFCALIRNGITPDEDPVAVSGATGGVGSLVLATLIKSLNYDGVVTACGMVNGGDLPITVFPFIGRGIQLIGIDSVQYPMEKRSDVWEKLGVEWLPDTLDQIQK